MFMGKTHGIPEFSSQKSELLPNDAAGGDDDEEGDSSSEIIYMVSFDELTGSYIQYDTIIWLSISLLLVLAWGVGIFMLLYLPVKRFVLRKDLSCRKLYVTPTEIVYKVSRPSFIPCWKTVMIQKRVPLSLVINIIIEQGWLQSIYGLHTFRVESISRGKAAPVDELQVQGLSNPGLLRKVILREAARVIQEAGSVMTNMSSLADRVNYSKSPSKNWKAGTSTHRVFTEGRGVASGDLLLHKLDEMNRSVKIIESLIDKPQTSTAIS